MEGSQGLIMMVLIIGVMYFFMIRPQQKKQKEQQKFRNQLQKGNRVVTIGGIHGKVDGVSETTVVISVEGGTKMKVEKSAITSDASNILTEEEKKRA